MTTAVQHMASRIAKLSNIAALSLRRHADHMLQVIGFHDTYDVPMRPLGSADREFRHMDDDRVAMRLGLITEEVKELFKDGFGVDIDINYFAHDPEDSQLGMLSTAELTGEALALRGIRDGKEVADALGDIVYVCYGMALEMGYDLRAVIDEIHASNLTKLGADGQPLMREDGKVLKGPEYMEPNIVAALQWEVVS